MRGRRGAWVAAVLSACAAWSCERRGDVEVELWTVSLRPVFTGYMEERIAAFEASRPGVRVRWVDVPFEAIERKLIAASAAGRMPDVVNLSDMVFARFAGAGAFAVIDGEAVDLGSYHAGSLGVGRIGGAPRAVPWYLTTQSLIVNRVLLERGGLSEATLPRTWGGLMAAAGPFHEKTGAYLFTQPLGTDSQLPMMMLAEGLSPLRGSSDGGVESALSSPEVEVFLRGWVELYRSGAMPREAATRGFEHLIDVYQNERAAVVNTGANFLERIRDVSREVYERTVVMEPITGDLGAAHIAVMLLGVGSQSERPLEASALAGFLTSAESQSAFARLAPILPSTPASLEDAFFAGPTAAEVSAGLSTVGEARAALAEALRTAAPFTPSIEAWPEMRRLFNEGIKGVLLGGADLEATLAEIDTAWDGAIARMNARRVASGGRALEAEDLASVMPMVRR